MRQLLLLACSIGLASTADAQRSEGETRTIIDKVVARAIPLDGPGCAVGVSQGGGPVLKAYGSADLERSIPLTPSSILEAGSVSKQFTAAAITLLAIDRKLSFDDDVRRWFPELPDYGATITVRHLLTHTSGLRDWGNIAGMEGWPRGSKAYSNENVLEIAARQTALNYPPGSAYSYTNTGYNLLALLVQRASGKSLAEFTRERLFEPLGMKNTSWRDDYQRVVKGRALAYADRRGAFATDMPNEDAYGNGGLLTTVGDLLIWNDAMRDAKLGHALADSVVKRMVLTSGRSISYALGLFIVPNARGTTLTEIQHSGSTAGYRAHLIRMSDGKLSIAVLCNGGAATNASTIANQIADSLLPPRARPASLVIAPLGGSASAFAAHAGLWANDIRHTVVRTSVGNQNFLMRGNTRLSFVRPDEYRDGATTIRFAQENGMAAVMLSIAADGDTTRFHRVEEWHPSPSDLAALAGSYATREVHGEPFVAAVENGQFTLRQGLRTRIVLTPTYRDNFSAGSRTAWFTREANGRIAALHLSEDRAWDVAFPRVR